MVIGFPGPGALDPYAVADDIREVDVDGVFEDGPERRPEANGFSWRRLDVVGGAE